MIKAQMRRNIFDHYSQLENHITHALLSVLLENQVLTKKLLSNLKIKISEKKIRVLSQRMPLPSRQKESVIDGAIFADDLKFCIGVENKIVPNSIDDRQIKSHLEQLASYNDGWLWIITPDEKLEIKEYRCGTQIKIKHTSWSKLMSELRILSPHVSKGHGAHLHREFVNFLQRMPEMTGFHGLKFDYGYDPELAKNYVKRITPLLTPEIRKIYPRCKNSRPAISGSAWDSWYPSREPQTSVHPGYSIQSDFLRCTIVLANRCNKEWKNLSVKLENDPTEFMRIIRRIESRKPKNSDAVISFRQRHYPSQKAKPVDDAETILQINTLLGNRGSKKNDIWFDLIKKIAGTKRHYNYQLEIGYNIRFEGDRTFESNKALGEMIKCFGHLKPVYEYLTE